MHPTMHQNGQKPEKNDSGAIPDKFRRFGVIVAFPCAVGRPSDAGIVAM